MELFIMDENFRSLYALDKFESLIWTERYNGFGNFEFYTPANQDILTVVDTIKNKMEAKLDCYAWLKDNEMTMIIEDLEITTDAESGNNLIMSGRGLESILDRRIVWEQTTLDGKLQDQIEKLLNDSIMSPKISDRIIPNFKFKQSPNAYINSLSLRAQYTGDNLYDTILAICDSCHLGFDVYLDSNNDFTFTLTYGEDRSFDQEKNPYVVFSPKYENIINSDYLESGKTLKNVTLVAGEGEGIDRKTRIVGSAKGLSRKELYADARDIQSDSYSRQIDEDKEKLEELERSLENDQKSLADVIKEESEELAEHNKNAEAYTTLKAGYDNRIAVIGRRINDYKTSITNYVNGLSPSNRILYDSRETYKNQINSYDAIINSCTDKISQYNEKLSEDLAITYEDVLSYESSIEVEEKTRKDNNSKKNDANEEKRKIEEQLPSYYEKLYKYEGMISKYEDIQKNDQKSLADVIKEESEELAEHNKNAEAYTTLKAGYDNRIVKTYKMISEYKKKIAQEIQELNVFYNDLLDQRGLEKLAENVYTEVFTGEVEATKTFVYGVDFFKGDIMQIINEYGMESKVRVSEVVRVQDTTGYSMYPTFQVIE